VRKFYSVEEYERHFFPRDHAEKKDRELRESDPEEWARQRMKKSIDEAMERVFG
jgi:hypothetical protein